MIVSKWNLTWYMMILWQKVMIWKNDWAFWFRVHRCVLDWQEQELGFPLAVIRCCCPCRLYRMTWINIPIKYLVKSVQKLPTRLEDKTEWSPGMYSYMYTTMIKWQNIQRYENKSAPRNIILVSASQWSASLSAITSWYDADVITFIKYHRHIHLINE
jgi:hypothetical protein